MKARSRVAKWGPYSRPFSGQLSDISPIDGRTVQGKFANKLRHELGKLLEGHPPKKQQLTVVQKLLIERAVQIQLQLVALDVKLFERNFTDHDRRTFGALNNAFRLLLREIGAEAAEPPSLVHLMAAEGVIAQPRSRRRHRSAGRKQDREVAKQPALAALLADEAPR
jgi:hypothetical protein